MSLAERVYVGMPVIWYDEHKRPYHGVVDVIYPETGEIRCHFAFDDFTKLFDNHDLGRDLELSNE